MASKAACPAASSAVSSADCPRRRRRRPRRRRSRCASAARSSSRTKTKHVKPVYPPIAQSARVQGVVIIEATIGPNGKVAGRARPPVDPAARPGGARRREAVGVHADAAQQHTGAGHHDRDRAVHAQLERQRIYRQASLPVRLKPDSTVRRCGGCSNGSSEDASSWQIACRAVGAARCSARRRLRRKAAAVSTSSTCSQQMGPVGMGRRHRALHHVVLVGRRRHRAHLHVQPGAQAVEAVSRRRWPSTSRTAA